MAVFFFSGVISASYVHSSLTREDPTPWQFTAMVAAINLVCGLLLVFGDMRCRQNGSFGEMNRQTWLIGAVLAYAVGCFFPAILLWRLKT